MGQTDGSYKKGRLLPVPAHVEDNTYSVFGQRHHQTGDAGYSSDHLWGHGMSIAHVRSNRVGLCVDGQLKQIHQKMRELRVVRVGADRDKESFRHSTRAGISGFL